MAPYKKIYSFPNSSYGTEYHLEIMASCDGEKQPMEVPQIKKVCQNLLVSVLENSK